MQPHQLETIQPATLSDVTGGGWLDMLSGGKLNIGTLLGGANPNGGAFGVDKDGNGKGLAAGIAGLLGFGGGGPQPVEGKGR